MRTKIVMTSSKTINELETVEKEYKSGNISDMQYKWQLEDIQDKQEELVKMEDAFPIQGWIRHNLTEKSGYVVMSTAQAKKLRKDAMLVLTNKVAPQFLFPVEPGVNCKDERAGIIPVIVGMTNALKSLLDSDKDHIFIYSET